MSLSVLRGGIGPLTLGGKAPVTPWWLAGGVNPANVVAAYQPKGALSLADSYKNKANPGVFDAAPGVAPTWNATDGWIFNGSTQYLTTLTWPASVGSMIVSFTNVAGPSLSVLAGFASTAAFQIIPYYTGDIVIYSNQASGSVSASPGLPSGVLAVAGANCYRNGVAESSTLPAVTPISAPVFIGARWQTGPATRFCAARVKAFALYNNDQSARMAALYTAIAAL